MRYPPSQKPQTRGAILKAAGRMFRHRGYAGAGVGRIMGAAGLTVGGFYGHFASKEALLSEVLDQALQQTREMILGGLEDLPGDAWLGAAVRRYLSTGHRRRVAAGCILPTITPDLARAGRRVRRRFQQYLGGLVAEIERRAPADQRVVPRERAIATVALCVGGLMLARAVDDEAFAEEILAACRRFADAEET